MPQEIIIYFIVNFISTLLWWTIPASINLCRSRHKLPSRVCIWPLEELHGDVGELLDDRDGSVLTDYPLVLGLTIFYSLFAILGLVGVLIYKFYKCYLEKIIAPEI